MLILISTCFCGHTLILHLKFSAFAFLQSIVLPENKYNTNNYIHTILFKVAKDISHFHGLLLRGTSVTLNKF